MVRTRFLRQSHEVLAVSGGYCDIAAAARTCYRSEGNSSPESDERLVRSLVKNGHHAMLEHGWMSVRFVTDRAIANELVRHRLLSFAQESTRYVDYEMKGLAFVLPGGRFADQMAAACRRAAEDYEALRELRARPELARSVLPLCTATEIVASGNFREWRHVLTLRCAKDAHPMMRELMLPLLDELKERVPVVFDDVWEAAHED